MKFKNLLKFTPILFAIILLGIPDPISNSSTAKVDKISNKLHTTNGVELFFIISDRNGKSIEKVFANKTNALKYIETYKESHNYSIEEAYIVE